MSRYFELKQLIIILIIFIISIQDNPVSVIITGIIGGPVIKKNTNHSPSTEVI